MAVSKEATPILDRCIGGCGYRRVKKYEGESVCSRCWRKREGLARRAKEERRLRE